MISIEDCDAKLEELAALEKKVNSKGELNNNIKELQSNQYQLKILSSLHQSSLPKSTLDLDMLYNSREVIEYVVNLSYNNLLATKLAKLNELKFDSSMIDIQQLNKRKETALLFVDMIKKSLFEAHSVISNSKMQSKHRALHCKKHPLRGMYLLK